MPTAGRLLAASLAALFIVPGYAQTCDTQSVYRVGAGIYDITGPAAEEGMMGYGMLAQQTAGISQRLWARAFVIESPCSGRRLVFVNTDLGMVFQAVKEHVIQILKTQYGEKYTDENVLITATHTHSGPGGFSGDTLYNITTYGFDKTHFNTIVSGIVKAIERADANVAPATIKIGTGELPGLGHNRSPQAYLLNPATERAKYQSDVDTQMTLIRFDRVSGEPIGLINWFPLHGVSFNNKNHLISGDNKGYAEYLFEKDFASHQGDKDFVAAFAQANAGDVSPNAYGHEGGEGQAGLNAVEKAGRAQYEAAKKIYATATTPITGDVDARHRFVAMDKEPKLCTAAIGVSMLAGTQDGEGVGVQGLTCENVSHTIPWVLCEMSTTPCQGAKPIAVETGSKQPPWTPSVLPMQLFKVGQLHIIAAPMELTTMTGRRIQAAVQAVLPPNTPVVISALSNAYAGYVASHDEYELQRYEAASTHFGPYEQPVLSSLFSQLAFAMVHGQPVKTGPTPPDWISSKTNQQPGVLFDDKPPAVQFGAIHEDVKPRYHPGDIAQAVFWAGHPKNNYHTQGTYLAVQKQLNGRWQTIRSDNDFDTEFRWARWGASYSTATVVWHIPADIEKGVYRLVHYGDWKSGWTRRIAPYTGYSSAFIIQ